MESYSGEALRELKAAVEACVLKIGGEWAGPIVHPARAHRWGSIGEALRAYVVCRLDGYAMPNIGSPDRIAKQVHLGHDAGSSGKPPPAIAEADDLIVVERALEASLLVMGEDLPLPTRRLIVLARYAAKLTPLQIAERLEEAGCALTSAAIHRAAAKAARGITGRLEEAELMTPGEQRTTRVGEYDLRGWDEIARYMRASVRTAKRWRAEQGMPVRAFVINGHAGHVEASSDELDAWYADRLS